MKKIFFVSFFLIILFFVYSEDLVVNKIIYKKVLVDFDQISLINVYLNPMNVSDVNVFFNGKEIKKVYKNLKSLVRNDDNFFPSFNFEVSNVKKENNLQFFVTLSQGMVLTSEFTILFEKGIVVDETNFQTKKERVFFIKGLENINEGVFCELKIENDKVLEKIDEVIKNKVIYYKLKALKTGISKVDIYKYDENLSVQQESPVKTVKITIVDD